MKTLKVVSLLVLGLGLLFSTSSCAVFVRHDNGRHRGQYQNLNSPNQPKHMNPGHQKGKSKKVASVNVHHLIVQETMGQAEPEIMPVIACHQD